MTYTQLENSGLIVPEWTLPTKEFWRVMGKHSGMIVCVDVIDPDCTLHPTGIPWDVDGVHKWLPFKKGAGIHSLDEVTKKERQVEEITKVANEKRPEKEKKRKERDEEQNRVDEFYATPAGEKKVIYDTKIEPFIPEEMPEITKEPIEEKAPKKRGRPFTKK